MKRLSKAATARLGLSAVLASAALVGAPAPVSAACETVWVEAYDVKLEAGRRSYRIGDTARVEATVTRKDTGTPVAGADFAAIVIVDDAGGFDADRTDSAGVAVARLKLKKGDVEPGRVTIRSLAVYEVADASCATVVEYGHEKLRNAFTIEP